MAFIPHIDYRYPIHLDEWVVFAGSDQVMPRGNVSELTDPAYYGAGPSTNQKGETGTHLFWAVFHQISGIDWLVIFRYFPSVIFAMTILSVYVFARRLGFGWQAALLASLTPTTVGLLGPGFLVPVALGLLFIPLSLYLAFNFKTWQSYLAQSILITALIIIHPPTAVVLALIFIPFIILNLKSSFRQGLGTALALLSPFSILLFPKYRNMMPPLSTIFEPQPVSPYVDLPNMLRYIGYLPILLSVIGTLFLVWKWKKECVGLIIGILTLFLILDTFFLFHRGTGYIYYRGLLIGNFMMNIIAGAGLAAIQHFDLPQKASAWLKLPRFKLRVGQIAGMAIIILTLAIAIPALNDIPYYHMIDKIDYDAFIWIKNNINGEYRQAVLDPWKGIAFVALTGKHVYSYTGESPTPRDMQAYQFLSDGAIDTNFLTENGITIVYTRDQSRNPGLKEVREHVFLFNQ